MAATNTGPIGILLVDDHAVVRSGLRMLIENRPGLKVVGEAGNLTDALAIAVRDQPDIILLDLDLNGVSGLDLLPELLATASGARVIVLTAVHDPEEQYNAVRLGAVGVIHKEKAAEIVIKAIEKVHAGEVWLNRAMMSHVLAEMSQPTTKKSDTAAAKIALLTGREREVIALVGEGLKNKQIAARLFISETTVRHHLTSVFDKLDVCDRLELIIYAYRHGLAKLPS